MNTKNHPNHKSSWSREETREVPVDPNYLARLTIPTMGTKTKAAPQKVKVCRSRLRERLDATVAPWIKELAESLNGEFRAEEHFVVLKTNF